jgi:hypothetical protein
MSVEVSSNSGRRWASVSVEHVQGQKAVGFSRLLMGLKLSVSARPAGSTDDRPNESLTAMPAELLVGGQGGGPIGRSDPVPGQLPIDDAAHDFDRYLQMTFDLDRTRLEAIENVRNGSDLNLTLNLYPALANRGGYIRQANQALVYQVEQSRWVKILDELGYQRTLLIEVGVPHGQQPPSMAKALEHLAAAQGLIARGDYREAVGRCRDVLDAIKVELADDDQVDFKGASDMHKADRLRLIRRGLYSFTSAARHIDEVTRQFEWNRVDAVSAVSLVAAIVNELAAPGARAPKARPSTSRSTESAG